MRAKYWLLIGSVLLAAHAADAADAPMFRGDAQHSGSYEGRGVAALGGVKWTFRSGGQFIASPAVASDTVYQGGTDGFLYALARASGALKWKFETRGRIVSSPAVAGGAVYFLSYDGNLYAVDAASGALKWKFATGGEKRFSARHLHGSEPAAETAPDPWDCYLSSPTVWNGAVYFGSSDSFVYAVDAASGTLRWKFKTGDVVHASPAMAGGVLFIGSWDTYFYALDAATGAVAGRDRSGEVLPAREDHVGVARVELDHRAPPAGALAGDEGAARAAEGVEHEIARVAAVLDGALHQREGLG